MVFGLFCLTAAGQGNSKGKGKGKDKNPQQSGMTAAVSANLRFGSEEARIISDYYRPRLQQLPPGLAKKLQRGGTLPPGWQKKVQLMPLELDGRLPRVPTGCRRVVSGKVALLINDATNTILDILDLTR
jgi:hypothetical protein